MAEVALDTHFSAIHIKRSESKGRGVYASRTIPAQTVVDVSPILYFSKEEYEEHGKHTILDHYTFRCRDGRMALALGLGSIFNHSDTPNVSYTIDTRTDSIRYTTARLIQTGEELCIYYGHDLWFVPDNGSVPVQVPVNTETDDWANMSSIEISADGTEVMLEQDLPFTRIKLVPDNEEEEELSTIRTKTAWVVDVPEPQLITTLLQWIKQTRLGAPELEHLKRVRRQGEICTLLLCTSPSPPLLPSNIELPDPYMISVPRTAALTPNSLRLKSSLWPTLFTSRRKAEPESWTRGKLAWAWDAVKTLLQEAVAAHAQGELPIVAHVRSPYDSQDESPLSFTAHDTRRSSRHPLRHAVMNVIRNISDHHTLSTLSATPLTNTNGSRNGSNYLLTSMSLFVTHEPCIMCSMALLHSRVKDVIFLIPMEKTGGCSSLACLPALDGVNHRFGICRWNRDTIDVSSLEIESHVDA